jgi:hypothetical protein
LLDWSERLTAVFVASRGRAFEYGEHDCCIFAADCILAVTGREVAAAWRGNYSGAFEGLRLAGTRSPVFLASRLFRQVQPAMAWRGDVAAVWRDREFGLAVFDGANLRGTSGSVISRAAAIRAYRVE